MNKELAKTYDPKGLEDRLYQKWLDSGYFHAKVNKAKKPFTIVMPPPYRSNGSPRHRLPRRSSMGSSH